MPDSTVRDAPALSMHCEVTDYLWPWTRSGAVVMIHGFARSSAMWRRWVPHLAQERRVFRVDLPGMGASPPPSADWSVEGLLAGLDEILRREGLERANFIGESSGGMLATLFAATRPEKVSSLVLLETPLRRSKALRAEHNFGKTDTAASWGVQQYGLEEYCRRTVDARLDTTKAPQELIDWYVELIGKTPDQIAITFKDFIDGVDIEPSLASVKAPTLLVSGDKSRVITADQVAVVRSKVPNLEFHNFEGYGHGLPVLAPAECASLALRFWKRHGV